MQIQSSKYNNNKDKGVSWLEDNIGDGAAGTGLFTKTKIKKQEKNTMAHIPMFSFCAEYSVKISVLSLSNVPPQLCLQVTSQGTIRCIHLAQGLKRCNTTVHNTTSRNKHIKQYCTYTTASKLSKEKKNYIYIFYGVFLKLIYLPKWTKNI